MQGKTLQTIHKLKTMVIVNPIAGEGKGHSMLPKIPKLLNAALYDLDIRETKEEGHGKLLAKEACDLDYDAVIAVGGDGTINEIASSLIGTRTMLSLLPLGSGNGFARHLHVPLDPDQALLALNRPNTWKIDTATLNGLPFLNVAGAGFDGLVTKKFNENSGRGLFNYVKQSIQATFEHETQQIELEIGGHVIREECFAIAFANSTQYGNNFYVAPQASLTDGKLDIILVKKPPALIIPQLAWRMRNGTLEQSPYVDTFSAASCKLTCSGINTHIDGEYAGSNKEIEVKMNPLSLTLLGGNTL